MRHFKRYRLLILACVIAICMIGGALWYRSHLLADIPSGLNLESVLPPAAPVTSPSKTFTVSELAKFDGKAGHKCYVAIDTTVYEIKQGTLWKNGEHVTSGEQAMCGKDLTEAIKQSPHGRSKLETLPKVGTYK